MSPPPRWRVADEEAGERLDRLVARHLDRPRNQVQRWIADGRVTVDGRPAKPAAAVAVGSEITVSPPQEPAAAGLEPEPGALVVLHEGADLVVLDKPAGLAVHPGAGRARGTLAHRLLARYPELAGVGGPGRPGIVHRLDKDTSGVLVVARSDRAYRALSRAFAERRVDKRYLAVVYGTPSPPAGEIDRPIGRHPTERKKMAVRPGARPARTRYRVVASAGPVALLDIDLETGRTHQIRVHLKVIGHPLVGDPTYGEARWRSLPRALRTPLERFPRPALHARRLAFDHPFDGRRVAFEAPVPADLEALWEEVAGTAWPGG